MHPFRFGVQLSKASSPSAWRDSARKLEDLGYSTVFMPDHFNDQYGPLVALTVAAEATERLNVGALVFDNDYRHPLVLAKECATLDLMSEGRLEVGIGAGWMRTDYDESGFSYDSPSTRVSRMEEGVQVLKALWDRDEADFDGSSYKLSKAHGLPRPHTSGGPKLLIGGGSRRVLKIAAEQADIVGVNPSLRSGDIGPETIASAAPAHYEERIAWVREFAGDRLADIELQCLVFAAEIGRPQMQVAEEMSALLGFSPAEVASSPIGIFGTEDEIVETLMGRREKWGFSYWVLHEAEIDSFAPVVSRLAGT
ncbi:MAG: TIGR03621 family F420-dependent LLM class oxidoreductase [Acidimicrobiales bacterium]